MSDEKGAPAEVAEIPESPAIKLDIGGGERPIPGYQLVDRRAGQEAYPLAWPDNSVDEIRASHVLEHFGHGKTQAVLTDWVRALKPGGVLRVAVPSLNYILDAYNRPGNTEPIEGYLFGGQTDENDFHYAGFNRRKLWALMSRAGLIDIQTWESEVRDCAALPVSLNLKGIKPPPDVAIPDIAERLRVAAVMSTPRLGFMDMFGCAFQALSAQRIPFKKVTGAFWGQCLERCIEDVTKESELDAVLTIDYDTIFDKDDVGVLMRLMLEHPEADAIAAVQSKRETPYPLLTIADETGDRNRKQVQWEMFEPSLAPIRTAHFGLTLLRVKALLDVPHPWFLGVPGTGNRWGEFRKDPDIYFWDHWRECGKTLFLANHVVVGHCELMIAWPNLDLTTIHQHCAEYHAKGKPEDVWR